MTNREYLASLSNKELVRQLGIVFPPCEYCIYYGGSDNTGQIEFDYCNANTEEDCELGMLSWLESEHIED